ncbi:MULTISPECIES: MarR family winged helix-turn-helix transcriptional regulator [Bradyrhizobium]|uniref:DNA-binding transcriptional regulator, MarR family n=1 Tax=Bradyrhizobium brasilense TaxID=1419277 RepID=A0A1R1R221_9BRAD|nr:MULTISPECIES: MarR family transcriptional regulator [Bradyrhizobium]MCP1912163.1 DNA-binding MarR family transcriptional regulator [Bradyrhizobium elkanii]KRQ02226.1 MarR family transcriptional regulator [Bradyrhizobium pachyrhizi]MCA1397495.1 MarR family transcriptional regulator [Bradyrhizobium sp. BRP56]MCA6103972.1 MarR family transcriptional regulator [Bradyrhizobium australafricanum]MCC8972811.1 MarR family transcriptional regulator [Bradyrhizobium brasilense]
MKSEIASLTLRALRRVLRATEIGSRQLAIATGLTTSQWLVLREIDAREKTTPGVIAQALQFGQATITTIVDRLVALDLVQRQRNANDKRQFLLTATPAGRDIVANAPDLLHLTFTDRFVQLPQWEQAMILAAVERLAMLMDAHNIDAAPLLDSGAIDRSQPR